MPIQKNLSQRGYYWLSSLLILTLCLGLSQTAEARRKHHRRHHHRYSGPPPTHPVVLWARTLSESTDPEQRKIAAYKLAQYSQPIYQTTVVNVLIHCMGDPDLKIKVLCTKAMGHAGTQGMAENVREVLLQKYQADPILRSTIVRAFILRGDSSSTVQDTFLESAKQTQTPEELVTLLDYFQIYGSDSDKFVSALVQVYQNNENPKVKRAVVKALGDRSHGQDAVIALLSQCADNKDTPLALTCLSGLQLQAKKDARAWSAVEKTIQSEDPDVLMATLEVINSLPETVNPKISKRLLEIIDQIDDSELQEKAVLALGICGDRSDVAMETLVKLLKDKSTDESTQIAAALALGKQSGGSPEKTRSELEQCTTSAISQQLRMACQIGMKEFEARQGMTAQLSPIPPPAKPITVPAATGPAIVPAPTVTYAPAPTAATSAPIPAEKKTMVAAPSPPSTGPAFVAPPSPPQTERAVPGPDSDPREPNQDRKINSVADVPDRGISSVKAESEETPAATSGKAIVPDDSETDRELSNKDED